VTCIGDGNDFSSGGLCLQQIGSEIQQIQRVADCADDFSTSSLDNFSGVFLQRMSESIIRREYEPLFLSILDDGGGGPMGEAIRIVCPVKPIRRALFVGELCSARAGYQHEPTSVLGKTLNRECDGRIGNVHNHVN